MLYSQDSQHTAKEEHQIPRDSKIESVPLVQRVSSKCAHRMRNITICFLKADSMIKTFVCFQY